jgi:hypothetical protein
MKIKFLFNHLLAYTVFLPCVFVFWFWIKLKLTFLVIYFPCYVLGLVPILIVFQLWTNGWHHWSISTALLKFLLHYHCQILVSFSSLGFCFNVIARFLLILSLLFISYIIITTFWMQVRYVSFKLTFFLTTLCWGFCFLLHYQSFCCKMFMVNMMDNVTTRNFGFCNCLLQLIFSCMRYYVCNMYIWC